MTSSRLLKTLLLIPRGVAHRRQSPKPIADPVAEDDTRRGDDPQQAAIFSDISPEERVPAEHLWRAVRARALLRQGLYTVRSARLLMAQLHDNLLFRWFVGLNMDDLLWAPSTCNQNRARVLEGKVARAFVDHVVGKARERGLWSDEPCTVDGTRLDAWAGQKSCQRQEAAPPSPPDNPGNPSLDCHGERRTQATHASTTAPAARLYKKATGQETTRAYRGHVLMEKRHGLGIATRVTQATGTAEREAALAMAEAIPGQQRVTWGADKNSDTRDCVRELRVTPPVAQHPAGRSSAMDGCTTRPPGYALSQRKRPSMEAILGWLKTVGLLRKGRHRGAARVGWMSPLATAVYHMVRMRTRAAAACAQGKARLEGHLLSRPPWSQRGVQRLVMFHIGSHLTTGMLDGTAVQLLTGVFQQPARHTFRSTLQEACFGSTCQAMTRMQCPTATSARPLPRRVVSRRNCAARDGCFARVAAQAAWVRAPRT